jgi:hypothetical protein
MHRAAIGAGIGLISGVGCAVAATQLFVRSAIADYQAFERAAVMAAGGATTGAIIGGVGDVLAFLRHAFAQLAGGPEADYREPDPPAPPGPPPPANP